MQKFIVIVPVYNAENWIETCVRSITSQIYTDYQVIIIDDCSTDRTWDLVNRMQYKSIRNDVHTGSVVGNMVKCLKLIKTDPEDVCMVVDGDDYLADNLVFNHLNEVYKEYVWFTYGQYEPLSKSHKNFCQPIPDTKTYRKSSQWTIGQLRTWKMWLWNKVHDEDLRDQNGNYFTAAADRSFSYPMIEMAGKHVRLIEKVLYVYNDYNPINEFRIKPNEAINTANYIISKPIYKEL